MRVFASFFLFMPLFHIDISGGRHEATEGGGGQKEEEELKLPLPQLDNISALYLSVNND